MSLAPRSATGLHAAEMVALNGNHRTLTDLHRAIVETVAYADIFDYPLTVAEVHRYLVGVRASEAEVRSALLDSELVPRYLSRSGEWISLPGRESVVEIRIRRTAIAATFWPRALRYGRIIASLPFVRMVAITGELAVDNADRHSDIDYFIVTEPGRLWLCRAWTVALVRLARLAGDTICPNYILSERALELDSRSLYTAHELTQMVPISGNATYERLRALNSWSEEFLPNASGAPRRADCRPLSSRLRAGAEAALRNPVCDVLERWEMTRKIRKLGGDKAANGETAFSADWCKGHFDGHGQRTLSEFSERLRRVEEIAQ